jgi:hypothetical protein
MLIVITCHPTILNDLVKKDKAMSSIITRQFNKKIQDMCHNTLTNISRHFSQNGQDTHNDMSTTTK